VSGPGVQVRRAPTRFGPIEFRILPGDGPDSIQAQVLPPVHGALRQVVLRLRHPGGKRMHRVKVDDGDRASFDPDLGVVRLEPADGPIEVRADFR